MHLPEKVQNAFAVLGIMPDNGFHQLTVFLRQAATWAIEREDLLIEQSKAVVVMDDVGNVSYPRES